MMEKNRVEMNSVNNCFPSASILLCTWHVQKAFNKKLLTLNLTQEQRNSLKEILNKLIYSQSAEDYSANVYQLKELAPPEFLEYFTECWESCVKLWVHFFRRKMKTLQNNTNNRTESHNQKLKKYLSSDQHLSEAVKNLILFIKNTEIDIHYSNFRQLKFKKNTLLDNEIFQSISNSCTWKAAKHIYYQLLKLEEVSYEFNDEIVTDKKLNKKYQVDIPNSTCSCTFSCQLGLPCSHIFFVRNELNLDIFNENMIIPRWRKCQFYQLHSEKDEISSSTIECKPSKTLTSNEIYNLAIPHLQQIAIFLSRCGTSQFWEGMEHVKHFAKTLPNLFNDYNLTETSDELASISKVEKTSSVTAEHNLNVQIKDVDGPLIDTISIDKIKSEKTELDKFRNQAIIRKTIKVRGRPKKSINRKFCKLNSKKFKTLMKENKLQSHTDKIWLLAYNLKQSHMNILLNNNDTCAAWLDDVIINAAQVLLQKQFPFINGFQDPILGQIPNFKKVVMPMIQILHQNDHWLVASNIHCGNNNECFIYDSLHQANYDAIAVQVASILKVNCSQIILKCVVPQLQDGIADCGLFAIANAMSLAQGLDMTNYKLKQEEMREHLLKCFQDDLLTVFPSTIKIPTLLKAKQLCFPVYCSCRLPCVMSDHFSYNLSKMIECVSCKEWFHMSCVYLLQAPANDFYCRAPVCQIVAGRKCKN